MEYARNTQGIRKEYAKYAMNQQNHTQEYLGSLTARAGMVWPTSQVFCLVNLPRFRPQKAIHMDSSSA